MMEADAPDTIVTKMITMTMKNTMIQETKAELEVMKAETGTETDTTGTMTITIMPSEVMIRGVMLR